MTALEINPIPLLQDNYAWLVHDAAGGCTAVVDPSVGEPVVSILAARGLALDFVLNTHHHPDHTGGNAVLKARYGCRVVGPIYDMDRVPTIDDGLADGATFQFGSHAVRVLFVPGHTRGHIALWFEAAGAVFTGDTLFSLGCGRLFEGTAAQMFASLQRLAALPPATRVYCGHEYTVANARFALTVEPENAALQRRFAAATALRADGRPTLPSTIGEELATNPFLRAKDAEDFAARRRAKDQFRG